MYFSSKRQQFLIDQGYAFKVITHLHGIDNYPELVFKSRKEQLELLGNVQLASKDSASYDIGNDVKGSAGDLPGVVTSKDFGSGSNFPAAMRTAGSLAALSGGSTMSYMETNKSQNRGMGKDKDASRNSLFTKRDKIVSDMKKKKQQAK